MNLKLNNQTQKICLLFYKRKQEIHNLLYILYFKLHLLHLKKITGNAIHIIIEKKG